MAQLPALPAPSRGEIAAAVFIHPKSKNRPFHWGPFPLETLPRDASRIALEAARPRRRREVPAREPGLLVGAVDRYREIYAGFVDGEAAPAPAPLPDDLERRAADIKGGAYFMDASQVGICRLPPNAWCAGAAPPAGSPPDRQGRSGTDTITNLPRPARRQRACRPDNPRDGTHPIRERLPP